MNRQMTTRYGMITTQRARRNIDLDVQANIELLTAEGWSATQIHRKLEQAGTYGGRLPTLRTVQRIVSERTPRDKSGPWTMQDAGPDARTVLDVLAAAIEQTEGRVTTVSRDEAAWVVRLSQVTSGLWPYELWQLARLYVGRVSRGESASDLEAFLAYAPWRDGEAGWQRYDGAVDAGWLRPIPSFVRQLIEQNRKWVGEGI